MRAGRQDGHQVTHLRHASLPRFFEAGLLLLALIVTVALALAGVGALPAVVCAALGFVLVSALVTAGVEGRRKTIDRMVTYGVYAAFMVAVIPLISVMWEVLQRGLPGIFRQGFLLTSMNDITGVEDNATVNGAPALGGAYHAIVGTLQITLWATVISVPIGLLTAIYLVEYSRRGPLARAVMFFIDVMMGVPSIVAGLFAVALFGWIFGPGTKTGFVAAVALAVLMVPVVVRSSEEMLKVVPGELREASYALGVRKWRTILRVVIPTAVSGIASGVTIAIARVIGETAPILVTAGFATSINVNAFSGWMAALPTYIYTQILNPTSPSVVEPSEQRAWAAALVLIIMVMLLNVIARIVAQVFAPRNRLS